MSNAARIRTPWTHKLRRFRYGALPAICFIACVVLTFWLWEAQGKLPNAVAEVEWVSVEVKAGTDGTLMAVSPEPWKRLDPVETHQLLARVDPQLLLAELQIVEKELRRLENELEAEKVRIAREEVNLEHDHQREARRLAWQVEQYNLDVLDRNVQIKSAEIELKRYNELLDKYLEPLLDKGIVREVEVRETELLRDEVQERIKEDMKALQEAEQQLKLAKGRQKQYPPLEIGEAAPLLAPIQAAIATQQATMNEIAVRINALEIRSPVDGVISEIYCRPGQNVVAGDPIMMLAAHTDHRYAISYVRQEMRFRPVVGMMVDVRVRAPGSRPVSAVVETVGARVELVPPHQCRDPNTPEWGLPVRIQLPEPKDFPVRPGELIDVTYRTWAKNKAG